MPNNTSLNRWATILGTLTVAVMIVLPIAVIFGAGEVLRNGSMTGGVRPAGNVVAAAAVGFIGPAILLWTLNEMRKLFRAFQRGAVFTDGTARLIRRIGQGFLTLAVSPLLIQPLQSLLLTMSNPPGQRSMSIMLQSDSLFFALSGGLIIVIGWAMREATAIAAENRAFV